MARSNVVRHTGLKETPQPKVDRNIARRTALEGPQISFLLIAEQGIRLSRKRPEDTLPGIPLHSTAHRSVADGLHRAVLRVLLAASMLKDELYGKVRPDARLRLGRAGSFVLSYSPSGSHGKRLLMSVFAEDIALPVEPDVGMQTRSVPQKLEAHFGILREVRLWIEQRFDESVILSAIDVAQHDGETTEVGLRTEPRKQMCAPAVLSALPQRNVMIDIVRIAVRPVEDERLQAKFHLDLLQRHVGKFGLNPQAGQRIAFRQRTRELVVAKEADALQLDAQGTDIGRVQSVRRGCKLLPHSAGIHVSCGLFLRVSIGKSKCGKEQKDYVCKELIHSFISSFPYI